MSENNLKAHLGNNRVTFLTKNLGGGALEVVQTSDYYPFGLTMNQYQNENASTYPKNKYLYNGKEIQDDELNGKFFGMLDYGARFYDAQIGRFTCLDPIADQFPHVTPYNYAENRVVNCIDLWGLQAVMVSVGFRFALPMIGPWGLSGSYEIGLILDKNRDLVMYNTVSLGGSFGASIGIGVNGTYYHTANSYEDLLGLGMDLGVSAPFPIISGVQGNVSFSEDNGPKGGFTLSTPIPNPVSGGAAAYVDATFTNQFEDFGVHNLGNISASTIGIISQKMRISNQQVRILLLLMLARIQEEEVIEIPAATVTAQRPLQQKSNETRIQDMLWQSVRPNSYGNTGRYIQSGRTSDQYYSDDFLKWYYEKD